MIGECYRNPMSGATSAGTFSPHWAGTQDVHPWIVPIFNVPGWAQPQMGSGFQVAPSPTTVNWNTISTPHTGAMQVALGDGSVRPIFGGISSTTWIAACTVNDGTPLGQDWIE
jgi:hypothetical protein